MSMPFQVLKLWLRGLFALAILGAGIYCLIQWYQHREQIVVERVPVTHAERAGRDGPGQSEPRPCRGDALCGWLPWEFGFNRATAFLLGGLGLLGWSLGGGLLVHPLLWRRGEAKRPEHANSQTSPTYPGTRLHMNCMS